jgi:hypothetical protein
LPSASRRTVDHQVNPFAAQQRHALVTTVMNGFTGQSSMSQASSS